MSSIRCVVALALVSTLSFARDRGRRAEPEARKDPAEFVDLHEYAPDIQVKMAYASDKNFMGRRLAGYHENKCLLRRAAAERIARAQSDLRRGGQSLVVFDCYRPRKATFDMIAWGKEPENPRLKSIYYPRIPSKKQLFAHAGKMGYISRNSMHSRGTAIDLSIEDLDMGTPFDFFGIESKTFNSTLALEHRENRVVLFSLMRKYGMDNYPKEWWHYQLPKAMLGSPDMEDFDIGTGEASPELMDSESGFSEEESHGRGSSGFDPPQERAQIVPEPDLIRKRAVFAPTARLKEQPSEQSQPPSSPRGLRKVAQASLSELVPLSLEEREMPRLHEALEPSLEEIEQLDIKERHLSLEEGRASGAKLLPDGPPFNYNFEEL